jgi:hypothetical protein
VIGEAEKVWLLKDEEIEFLKTINIFGEFNDYKLDDGFNLVHNDIYIQVRELCLSKKLADKDCNFLKILLRISQAIFEPAQSQRNSFVY